MHYMYYMGSFFGIFQPGSPTHVEVSPVPTTKSLRSREPGQGNGLYLGTQLDLGWFPHKERNLHSKQPPPGTQTILCQTLCRFRAQKKALLQLFQRQQHLPPGTPSGNRHRRARRRH